MKNNGRSPNETCSCNPLCIKLSISLLLITESIVTLSFSCYMIILSNVERKPLDFQTIAYGTLEESAPYNPLQWPVLSRSTCLFELFNLTCPHPVCASHVSLRRPSAELTCLHSILPDAFHCKHCSLRGSV